MSRVGHVTGGSLTTQVLSITVLYLCTYVKPPKVDMTIISHHPTTLHSPFSLPLQFPNSHLQETHLKRPSSQPYHLLHPHPPPTHSIPLYPPPHLQQHNHAHSWHSPIPPRRLADTHTHYTPTHEPPNTLAGEASESQRAQTMGARCEGRGFGNWVFIHTV